MGRKTRAAARFGVGLLVKKLLLPVLAVIVAMSAVFGLIVVVAGTGSTGTTNASMCTPAGASGSSSTVPTPSKATRESQIKVAKQIDEGVKELGFSGQASRIIIIAAMGESTLTNIGYGDDIHGVRNPDGSLTTSIGILQQQNNWGSREERMNPKTAAQLFILGAKRQGGGLADVPGWEAMSETQAIHKVQANADPNHYTKSIAYADGIIKEAGIDVGREGKTSEDTAKKPAADDGATAEGANCSTSGKKGGNSKAGDTYPWAGKTPPPSVYIEDGAGFFYGECTSYAMWKLAEHFGAKDGKNPGAWKIGNTTGGNGSQLGNGADWRAGWEARGWKVSKTPTANSVAWWAANGAQGIGSAGHVAWVDSVEDDGQHFVISEYNNSYEAPPGHKYSKRDPITMDAPGAPNAFLIPPDSL